MNPLALWLLRGGANIGRPFVRAAKGLFDPRRTRFEEGAHTPLRWVDDAGVEHWGPSSAVRRAKSGTYYYPKGVDPARAGVGPPTRAGARPRTPARGSTPRTGTDARGVRMERGYSPRGAPAGWFPRHPGTSILAAGAAGIAAPFYFGGESDEDLERKRKEQEEAAAAQANTVSKAREALESSEQSSASPGHLSDYKKKSRTRLKKGMKQLFNQYMILCMVAPEECDNFLKTGMKMLEADEDFKTDLYTQDVYDTIFQPGNMPSSGREAFAALNAAGIDPTEAMDFSKSYHDIRPQTDTKAHLVAKKEELQWDRIEAKLDGTAAGLDAAARELATAWVSGSIKPNMDVDMMPIQDKIKHAKEILSVTSALSQQESAGSGWVTKASKS